MYWCYECKTMFEETNNVTEVTGEFMGIPYEETFGTCPLCGSEDYEEMDICPCCKSEYKLPKQYICKDCEQELIVANEEFLWKLAKRFKNKPNQIKEWLEEIE